MAQQEMVDVNAAKEVQNDCAMPCAHEQDNACELGNACGSCIPPLAHASRPSHAMLFPPVSPTLFAAYYSSHIAELPDRPPMVG